MPDPMTIGVAVASGAAGNAIAHKVTGSDGEMVEILRDILDQLTAQAHYSDVQRERTLYPINLVPSRPLYSIAGDLRMEFLIVSGAPGDEMALQQGTGYLFTWINVSGDPIQIPAPLLLSGDVSIVDITDGTATDWRATIFAHRDTNIGMPRR